MDTRTLQARHHTTLADCMQAQARAMAPGHRYGRTVLVHIAILACGLVLAMVCSTVAGPYALAAVTGLPALVLEFIT